MDGTQNISLNGLGEIIVAGISLFFGASCGRLVGNRLDLICVDEFLRGNLD